MPRTNPARYTDPVRGTRTKQEAELKKAYQKARRAYEKQDVDQMISANVEFRATWLEAVQNAFVRWPTIH